MSATQSERGYRRHPAKNNSVFPALWKYGSVPPRGMHRRRPGLRLSRLLAHVPPSPVKSLIPPPLQILTPNHFVRPLRSARTPLDPMLSLLAARWISWMRLHRPLRHTAHLLTLISFLASHHRMPLTRLLLYPLKTLPYSPASCLYCI
jgi:hypothetical protein